MADDLKSFIELFNDHKGQKVIKHITYPYIYDLHFSHLRDKKINILELGVAYGGSTEIWLKYFPNATITAVDILPEIMEINSLKNSDRVNLVVSDLSSSKNIEEIAKKYGPFDIIMDDASHLPDHQIKAFNILFDNHLSSTGVYLVEDIQHKDNLNMDSDKSFFNLMFNKVKKLNTDKLNLANFAAVSFYDNIIVVNKDYNYKTNFKIYSPKASMKESYRNKLKKLLG